MPYCRKCGTELNPADKSCGECGVRVAGSGRIGRYWKSPAAEVRCVHCGFAMSAGDRFCADCGALRGVLVHERAVSAQAVTSGAETIAVSAGRAVTSSRALFSLLGLYIVLLIMTVVKEGSWLGLSVPVLLLVAGFQYGRLISLLAPWWRFQRRVPKSARWLLAFFIPSIVGYSFGSVASGREWTATLFSMTIGISIAFLFLFSPPQMRRRRTTVRHV